MQTVGLGHFALNRPAVARFGARPSAAVQSMFPVQPPKPALPEADQRILKELFYPQGLLDSLWEELVEAGIAPDKTLLPQQTKRIQAVLHILLRGGMESGQIIEQLKDVVAPDTLRRMLEKFEEEQKALGEVWASETQPQSPMLFKGDSQRPLFEVLGEWMWNNLRQLSDAGLLTASHLNIQYEKMADYLASKYGIQVAASGGLAQAMNLVTLVGGNHYTRFSQYETEIGIANAFVDKRKHHTMLWKSYQVILNQLKLGIIGEINMPITVDSLHALLGQQNITEKDVRVIAKALEMQGYLSRWRARVGRTLIQVPQLLLTDARDSQLLIVYRMYTSLLSNRQVDSLPSTIPISQALRQWLEEADVFPCSRSTIDETAAVNALSKYIAQKLDAGELNIGDTLPGLRTQAFHRQIPEIPSIMLPKAESILAQANMQILLPTGSLGYVILQHPEPAKRNPEDQERLQTILYEYGFVTFPNNQSAQPTLNERALIRIIYQLSLALNRAEGKTPEPGWTLQIGQHQAISENLRKLVSTSHAPIMRVFEFLEEEGYLQSGENWKMLVQDPRGVPMEEWLQRFRRWEVRSRRTKTSN